MLLCTHISNRNHTRATTAIDVLQIKGWKSNDGGKYLYNDRKEFDGRSGRFTTKTDGFFLCSTQIRLDAADKFVWKFCSVEHSPTIVPMYIYIYIYMYV